MMNSSGGPQYHDYYPQWRPWQLNISTQACNSTLAQYNADYRSEGTLGHFTVDSCYNHLTCILNNTPEAWKASMAAASVALGLLPTLLATIGPTISETSLLSSQRPVLAFLVSLGAPATQPTRLFEYEDPIDLLGSRGNKLVIFHLGVFPAAVVSGLEYTLAAIAVGNALQTSYQLGVATVSATSCTIWELPLIWSLLSVVVHLIAAIGFYIRIRGTKQDHQSPSSNTSDLQISSPNHLVKTAEGNLRDCYHATTLGKGRNITHPKTLWDIILQQSKREFLPCSNLPRPIFRNKDTVVPSLAVLFAVIASTMAYVQLVCGTVWLASLQLVSVKDAISNVLLRYALSAILCRLILLVELGGMRRIK